jgi:hypothetical protein
VPVARLVAAAEVTREGSGEAAGYRSGELSARSAFEIVLKGAMGEGIAIHAAIIALRAAHGAIDEADLAAPPRRPSRRALGAFASEAR